MKPTIALFSLCLLPLCPAQERAGSPGAPTSQSRKQGDGAQFTLQAGSIKLSELIDRSAVFLGWNILTSEQEMASASPSGPPSVQLQNPVTTDRNGCEELLTSLLYRSGFALTALDADKKLYEVISLFGPRQRDVFARAITLTPDEVLARPSLKVAVTTVLPLKHTNATIATNALRPFFASTGGNGGSGSSLTLGNVGNNTAMLLSGMQDQVAAALRLLEKCDVEPTPEMGGTPPLAERVEALERRIAELEKKLAKPQDR